MGEAQDLFGDFPGGGAGEAYHPEPPPPRRSGNGNDGIAEVQNASGISAVRCGFWGRDGRRG